MLLKETSCASWSLKTDSVQHYAYWDNAFSVEECDSIIMLGKSYEMYNGVIFGENDNYRDSKIVFLAPVDNMKWVYQKLTYYINSINSSFFNFDLWGFAENLQFTEYNSPGGKYNSHIDKCLNSQIRKLSIVLQLTDENSYVGGDFELLNSGESKPEKLSRKQGTLLVFPSYSLHRVTPMISGTRHSLVGWITGPDFK